MATATDVLTVARAELGTKESPAYSNNVKYNTEFYGRSVSGSSYPWCMVFVWWVFKHAGAADLFFGGGACAGCTTFMRWARQHPTQWITSGYQPGDIVLWDFDSDASESEHVGICESVNGASVTCIEGNTGSSSDSDGGQVMRRTRSSSLVIGAYRPAYDAAANSAPTPAPAESSTSGGFDMSTLSIISTGSTGRSVEALQALLTGYGYNCHGVDGIFGANTLEALKEYQGNHNLDVDGYCGPLTWASLLK